ncbi:MAG: EpsG family protein [Agathobacter sp.]|nr:EpsG family protein [Agathobacter sp.]
MELLYTVVLIANIISLFSKKGRRIVGICSLIVLSMVVLTMQNDALDLFNYKRRYENIYSSEIGIQPLYYLLQVFFRNINVDFDGFRISCFLVCMIGIYLILNNITDSFNTFAIVYMMYFFFLDGEQIRNFMASCILIVAFYYLLGEEKHNVRNFIICIVIATLIHTVFIVYFSFIIVRFKFDLNKIILRVTPLIAILVWIIFRYFNVFSKLLLIINDERAISYATSKTNFGWVIPTILYLLAYFLLKKLNSEYANRHESVNVIKRFRFIGTSKIKRLPKDINCSQILSLLYDVNKIGLMFLPLMLGTLTFYRVSKNIIFVDCVFLTAIWDYLFRYDNKFKYIKYYGCFLIIIFGYCIFDFSIYNEWKNFYDCYFSIKI